MCKNYMYRGATPNFFLSFQESIKDQFFRQKWKVGIFSQFASSKKTSIGVDIFRSSSGGGTNTGGGLINPYGHKERIKGERGDIKIQINKKNRIKKGAILVLYFPKNKRCKKYRYIYIYIFIALCMLKDCY